MLNIFNRKSVVVEKRVKRLTKDIDRLLIIQDIISQISQKNSFEEIAKVILNEIEGRMNYSAASISTVDVDKDSIALKYLSDSFVSKFSANFILAEDTFTEIALSSEPLSNTKLAAINSKIIIGESLKDFIVPPLSVATANIIQKLARIKTMVAIPIKVQGKVIAVLNFSMHKSKSEISINELKTLELFSDQIGLIIDNVEKYEKINTFNTELKEQIEIATADLRNQNHDIQSLYNLTSRISQSLDPNTVTQIAVDALPQDENMIGASMSLLNDKKDRLMTSAVTQNRISAATQKIIGDFTQYSLLLSDPSKSATINREVLSQNKPYSTSDIGEILSPPIPGNLIPALSKLLNIKSAVVFPLYIRGEAVGTIVYYLRGRDFDELNDNQKQLFQTYTTQIAISLENANLYQSSKEVQLNLQKALGDLQDARRRERDMIDIMGHELRTPMSIVRNALSMMDMTLKSKGEIPIDKQIKYVDIGLESARRESNLIETLLSATKADSKGFQLTFEKVDMLDVIEDSLVGFRSTAKKKGLKLDFIKPDTEEALVYCDRTRIQEIVDNFTSNAIKYTQEGFVKISIEDRDGMLWTVIEDSGMGIASEDLKKLGRKFFRAQQHMQKGSPVNVIRPGGTGLGLYVSFALTKIMEGEYRVESTVGKGSKFMFGIPKYKGQEIKQVERKVQDFAVSGAQ